MKKISKLFPFLRFSLSRKFSSFSENPSDFISHLETSEPKNMKIFRLIDLQGNPTTKDFASSIPTETLEKIYKVMVKTEEMDQILEMAQRQGKISFYMTSYGETACVTASAAAVNDSDLMFPQYREQSALLWRGFQIRDATDQCAGTHLDPAKGRQMPVHYGSKKFNVATISSPLGLISFYPATQISQASGAGYAFRIKGEDKVAITYFGEGAASEGDFHAALNFASTLNCQTLFLCRNNGFAISTPSTDQYAGDGIAGRGMSSYGIQSFRVDGNDALATYIAVKKAREIIIKEKKPALIEFMTYRLSNHSTSDHSILYRPQSEIDEWNALNNPINRLRKYLSNERGLSNLDDEEKTLRASYRKETIDSLKASTEEKLPKISDLFIDVYDQPTANLKEQNEQLARHLKKYAEHYPLHKYEND